MKQRPEKVHILVVDDEPMIRTLLKERLSLEGFDCDEASNGAEALDALAAREFDLVISDLRMPKMTGIELLKLVRTRFPDVAFVMATGESDVRIGVQAMKEGASDYITKPFQGDAAVGSVRRALEKRRLEMELADYRLHLEEMVERRTRELQVAMQRIEQTYDETLGALGAALELRDLETEGHSRRVALYCLELAHGMGCTADETRNIVRGSFLHDIGKIGIPDAILLKPARLTDAETVVMQTHAKIGYDLLSRIAFLASAAQMVLTHQERFDGTGYPQRLRGEEIPLGARIFAVADTFDAMTSSRPYRQALPFRVAREEIAREAGHQFDPRVVQVFLAIPQETWQRIRDEVHEQSPSAIFAMSGGERPAQPPAV